MIERLLAAVELGRESLGGAHTLAETRAAAAALVERAGEPDWARPLLSRLDSMKGPAAHAARVAVWTVALASQHHLSPIYVRKLVQGALLHDLGEVMLPPEMFTRAGPLDAAERQALLDHPRIGGDLLRVQGGLEGTVWDAIVGHHERLDGRGYPVGLAGEEIDFAPRLIGLLDVFDALTHPRPYAPCMGALEAIEHLRADAGFDQDLVEQLAALAGLRDAA